MQPLKIPGTVSPTADYWYSEPVKSVFYKEYFGLEQPGIVKYWNGTDWTKKPKSWNGSIWTTDNVKAWDGVAWV